MNQWPTFEDEYWYETMFEDEDEDAQVHFFALNYFLSFSFFFFYFTYSAFENYARVELFWVLLRLVIVKLEKENLKVILRE